MFAYNSPHLLGSDIRNYPVSVPSVSSIVFLGHPTRFLTLFTSLNFFTLSLVPSWIMICDDPDTILRLQSQYDGISEVEDTIRVIEYEDIGFDLIQTGLDYPKFLRLILGLWEEILPADSKAGGASISGKICEYLELQRVLSNDKVLAALTATDLIKPSTYGQFNIDPSSDVFAKLRPVLSLRLFNSRSVPLETLEKSEKNIVIDVSSITKLERLSLLLLLLVLNDQRIFSRWLVVQLVQSNLQLDQLLAKLGRSISLTDVFVHIPSIGDQLSWLRQFDLYLADVTMKNSRVRSSLFYPNPVENRIDLNLYGQRRTALRLE